MTHYRFTGSVPIDSLIGSVVVVDDVEMDGHVIGFSWDIGLEHFWINLSTGKGVALGSPLHQKIEFNLQPFREKEDG